MMRLAFYGSFGLNVLVALLFRVMQPARIAVHFGAGGQADRWGSANESALLMVGLSLLMCTLFASTHRLLFVFPPSWVNLPNKAYWLKPEMRPETEGKMRLLMHVFGCVWFLFWLSLQTLTFLANRSDPVRLNSALFGVAFGAFSLAVVAWLIALYRAFRLPTDESLSGPPCC